MKTRNKLYKFSPFGGLITLCILLTLTATSCKKDKNVPKEDDPNTVTDIDGNKYKTVKIGEQIWMAENLNTSRYNDGTAIPEVTEQAAWAALETGAWCHYDNDPTNGAIYGRLYNWYAANSEKLCPTGWHVPTYEEWKKLADHLGGEAVAGGKMKDKDTKLWTEPNVGATNESGFTLLPGGRRTRQGEFVNMQAISLLSGFGDNDMGFTDVTAVVNHDGNGVGLGGGPPESKKDGLSCRCVQD